MKAHIIVILILWLSSCSSDGHQPGHVYLFKDKICDKLYISFEVDSTYKALDDVGIFAWESISAYRFASENDTIAIVLYNCDYEDSKIENDTISSEARAAMKNKLSMLYGCRTINYERADYFFTGNLIVCDGGKNTIRQYYGCCGENFDGQFFSVYLYSISKLDNPSASSNINIIIKSIHIFRQPQ